MHAARTRSQRAAQMPEHGQEPTEPNTSGDREQMKHAGQGRSGRGLNHSRCCLRERLARV